MFLVMGITGKAGGGATEARHSLAQGRARTGPQSREGGELGRPRRGAGGWRLERCDSHRRALKGVEGAFVMLPAVWAPSLDVLQVAQSGTLPVFYNPTNRKSTMIATADVSAEVAKLLTARRRGQGIASSSWVRMVKLRDEVAGQLGEVIKRDVKAFAIPRAG